MTRWSATVGDVFDIEADALVCSANPWLNLSGGVGGEFRLRYGDDMQRLLHDHLQERGTRHVAPGTVVEVPGCGSPYQTVLHAVAIDVFYDSTPELIRRTYQTAFGLASQSNCRTVVSACLACGYGRATPEQFAIAVRSLAATAIGGIERIEFRSRDETIIEAVRTVWADVGR